MKRRTFGGGRGVWTVALVIGCAGGVGCAGGEGDSSGDGDRGDGDLAGDGDASSGGAVIGDGDFPGDGDASSGGAVIGDGDASAGGAVIGDGDGVGGGFGGSAGGGASVGGSNSGGSSSGGAGTGGTVEECDNSYPEFSCDDLGEWPSGSVTKEDEILALVNQHRTNGANCGGDQMPAVDPLVMDEDLRCAARVHSQDMASRSYFSHATWNPDACECSSNGQCGSGLICDNRTGEESPMRCGKGPSLRVSEIGGPSGAGWENIAAGNSTAAATMTQWMDSDGHCRNIMNGSLKTIGVGYATGGPYGHYWTQSFDN